jgi:hypothetical protein
MTCYKPNGKTIFRTPKAQLVYTDTLFNDDNTTKFKLYKNQIMLFNLFQTKYYTDFYIQN